MLANINQNYQGKCNTVIFVENTLFVSGISSILECNGMEVKKLTIDRISVLNTSNSVYICQVPNEEIEQTAQEILLNDGSTKLIIIKNTLNFDEIEKLLNIGVKGVCLTDIDEAYLVNAVKQVKDGHLIIDHRFTHELYLEYKQLKSLGTSKRSADDSFLKKLLTKRELEILYLLVKGYSNLQISKELFITNRTVKNHVANILYKLEVKDRLNAVIKAVKNNWITIS